MARQKGIIPLVGTIGGINFYYLNGVAVARKAGGGFNGYAIRTKASMVRVRENGKEFGECSRINKDFRRALLPFYLGAKFSDFHSRLMGLFTRLKNMDGVGRRGERKVSEGISTEAGMRLLKEFDYTPECHIDTVLPFRFDVKPESFDLDLPDFDIEKVRFVKGADRIELNYGLLHFDAGTWGFSLYRAEPIILDKGFEGSSLKLKPDTIPEGKGTVMAILGVRFYQEANGTLYLLNAQNAVGISVLECISRIV